MIDNIKLLHGDCLELMKDIPDGSVDLTVTSPPYDNLRTYNGNIDSWNFEKFQDIAKELFRITKQGDVVLDCFMGSGTTGIACINTGRKFIGMEIDKTYFEIAENRINEAASRMVTI